MCNRGYCKTRVITNNNAQNFNNQSPNPQNNIDNQNNIQQ